MALQQARSNNDEPQITTQEYEQLKSQVNVYGVSNEKWKWE